MPFPVKSNFKENFFTAFKEGKSRKAFELWTNHVHIHSFLQKCGLLLDANAPHKVMWHLRLHGSNYKTIGINKTLDGQTTPILKWTWAFETLWFELDWLLGKLVTRTRNIILFTQHIELEGNPEP